MRHGLTLLLVLLPTLARADDPPAGSPQAEYLALGREYIAARTAWMKSVPEPEPAKADPFWIEHYRNSPDWAFAPRLIAFSEAHPQEKVAADTALMVLEMNPSARDAAVFPTYLRARDLLIRDHLEEDKVVQTCFGRPTFLAGNMEPYFEALLARSKNRDTLARACMGLVECNELRLRVAARPFFDHADDHPEWEQRARFLNSRLDPAYIEYFRTADVSALTAANEALLERVVNEFGDIPQIPAWARPEVQAKNAGRKLADLASARLFRIRSLAPGQVAPEIVGEDIDGQPMKLSDYRGKVVVLVFWGTWCGPCMRSLPMEKALAARLKDQPFALVGINSDSDRDKVKEAVAREGITWRSWFDGGRTTGPIAERWNIRGWPTIIVIDQQGVIRFKGLPHHTPKPLDEAVDSLLVQEKP